MLGQVAKLEHFSTCSIKAKELLTNAKESGDISVIKMKTSIMGHG